MCEKNQSRKNIGSSLSLQDFIVELKQLATSSHDQELQSLISLYEAGINGAEKKNVDPAHVKKLEKEVENLRIEVGRLKKNNEIITSDKFLLEHKRKELLLMADSLEEAYEAIWHKNEELIEQKRHITDQTQKLKEANDAILAKNQELEDQADYLHTANETISKMHNEVKNQKDEILQKNIELISLNNEKNSLIGIVAHDLKSPLSRIQGLISVIKLNPDKFDKETLGYLDTIESIAGKLNEMIAKILNVEAIEAKKLNINFKPLNLSHVLSNCLKQFELSALEKEISIDNDIIDDITVEADENLINQIVENLISNALKFSPRRSTLNISLFSENQSAVLRIKDEGPGISKDDQQKLFRKYQKLSARPTGNESSTGLGLSIVKKYVDAMDGEIWCESEIGRGTSFYVKFKTQL